MKRFTATLLLLTLLFTGCGRTEPSAQSAEYPGLLERGDFCLSLVPDEDYVLLNGETVPLALPAFEDGDCLYFPLRELLRLFGGSYRYERGSAEVKLGWYELSLTAGERGFRIDNLLKTVDADPPVERDGELYLPLSALEKLTNCRLPMPSVQEGGVLIWHELPEEREYSAAGLSLGELFVPGIGWTYLGVVGEEAGFCRHHAYRRGGITVCVGEKLNEGPDDEGIDGRILAIRVKERGIPSGRGLEVGDSALRAWRLYGRETSYPRCLTYRITDGAVSEYRVFNVRVFFSGWLDGADDPFYHRAISLPCTYMLDGLTLTAEEAEPLAETQWIEAEWAVPDTAALAREDAVVVRAAVTERVEYLQTGGCAASGTLLALDVKEVLFGDVPEGPLTAATEWSSRRMPVDAVLPLPGETCLFVLVPDGPLAGYRLALPPTAEYLPRGGKTLSPALAEFLTALS